MGFWRNAYTGTVATLKQGGKAAVKGYAVGYTGVMALGAVAVAAIAGIATGGLAAPAAALAWYGLMGVPSTIPAVLSGPTWRGVGTAIAIGGLAVAGGALAMGFGLFSPFVLGLGAAAGASLLANNAGTGLGVLNGAIGLIKGVLFKAPEAIAKNKEQSLEKERAYAEDNLRVKAQEYQEAVAMATGRGAPGGYHNSDYQQPDAQYGAANHQDRPEGYWQNKYPKQEGRVREFQAGGIGAGGS